MSPTRGFRIKQQIIAILVSLASIAGTGDYTLTPQQEQVILQELAEEIEERREVRERQERLAGLGWYEGAVDGIDGPLTSAAREDFQEAADDLEPTGDVTPKYEQVLFSDDAPKPPPPPEPEPEPQVQVASTERSRWDQLADCESGNWINGGASFETGSARWYWGKPGTEVPSWGSTTFHGGLQFHPGTWSSFKSDHHPQYAYDATREQQIEVAERVLSAQGWRAWPTCTSKLGWR